jgi:hypothetical protein
MAMLRSNMAMLPYNMVMLRSNVAMLPYNMVMLRSNMAMLRYNMMMLPYNMTMLRSNIAMFLSCGAVLCLALGSAAPSVPPTAETPPPFSKTENGGGRTLILKKLVFTNTLHPCSPPKSLFDFGGDVR